MTQTIKYIGAQQRWSELPYTGAQSVWAPGQIEARSDVDAAALMASGVFEKIQGGLGNVELTAIRSLLPGDGLRAYRAWMAQPKTYKLAVVPDPTRFIDFNRGSDTNDGLTAASAWKTLQKLQTALPAAGNCIALANDSLFDLTDRVSFSVGSSTALNGASEASRLTITNYDPGGYPTQRPRIRYRYLPTNAQWTWDAVSQSWYYANPTGRNFTRDALGRFAGAWGSQKAVGGQALVAGLLVVDGDMYSDDTNKRMYVYAPAGTNPTDYYGGAGSVILGEGEGPALSFSRCGKYLTIDGLIFEECGYGIAYGNFSATESLVGFVAQRNTFINCGKAIGSLSDTNSSYTVSGKFLQNTVLGIGGSAVHLYCKAKDWEVAGNLFCDINNSMSAGGGLYAQEGSSGTTAHGNNVAYENYVERAKFNRGLSPYDGAGIYVEFRGKGWTLTRNFFAKSHHGIYNNSGAQVVATHNVFDDVDIPYSVSDASSIGATNSTFVHNTLVQCGLTRYRNGGTVDNVTAPINVNDNIGSGKTINHQNNLIQLSSGTTAQAAMNIRTGSVYDASGNHLDGVFGAPVRVAFNGTVNSTPTPTGTTTGGVAFGEIYGPAPGSVTAGVALSTLPIPCDIYGVRRALPLRGAVSMVG